MYAFEVRFVLCELLKKKRAFNAKQKKTKNMMNVLFRSQSELPYVTWQEVQARIVEIQKEHQICIHKKELSELDIYHRILRFKNYMVSDSIKIQTFSFFLF